MVPGEPLVQMIRAGGRTPISQWAGLYLGFMGSALAHLPLGPLPAGAWRSRAVISSF
jgi:hypothetical protein